MSIYIGNNKYKEIYLGSNKISEVYLGSNKIYSDSSTPIYEYANFGTQSWSSGGPSFTLPAEANIPYNYMMFKLYIKLPYISTCRFGDHLYLRTINRRLGTCIMGIRYNVTDFVTAPEVTDITTNSKDGYTSYKWAGWTIGSEALYRIIYDMSNRRPYVYVGNTYLGYGIMNASMLDMSMSFNCFVESGTTAPSIRNIRIVGGNTIEDLLAYTDGN